jgi:hypothetical protein
VIFSATKTNEFPARFKYLLSYLESLFQLELLDPDIIKKNKDLTRPTYDSLSVSTVPMQDQNDLFVFRFIPVKTREMIKLDLDVKLVNLDQTLYQEVLRVFKSFFHQFVVTDQLDSSSNPNTTPLKSFFQIV